MSRVRFFYFSQKKGGNIRGREHLDRARIFWQVVPVNSRYSTAETHSPMKEMEKIMQEFI